MKDNVWKRIIRLKRLWFLLLIPVSMLILLIVKKSTWVAEVIFAKGVYKVVSHFIAVVTGLLPFSLAEWILVLGPIALAALMIIFIIRLIRTKQDVKFRIIKALINVSCVLSIGFFVYTIGCGTNYHRASIGVYLGLTIEPSSEQELYGLCLDLADRANELREQITSVDEDGVYKLSMNVSELAKEAQNAYKKIAKEMDVFSGLYPKSKPVFFSRFMSKMEITGIFIPFTMEANVNVDIPDYSIASTMCHELAHLQGFMREDEANYISYLVTTTSGNVELAYSGVMEALILSGNALYDKNKELYAQLRETYSEGVVVDLRANSKYWKQFENTTVSTMANKVNDTYLKVNNQDDGVQSYGRMVDLLLAEYRSKNETNK